MRHRLFCEIILWLLLNFASVWQNRAVRDLEVGRAASYFGVSDATGDGDLAFHPTGSGTLIRQQPLQIAATGDPQLKNDPIHPFIDDSLDPQDSYDDWHSESAEFSPKKSSAEMWEWSFIILTCSCIPLGAAFFYSVLGWFDYRYGDQQMHIRAIGPIGGAEEEDDSDEPKGSSSDHGSSSEGENGFQLGESPSRTDGIERVDSFKVGAFRKKKVADDDMSPSFKDSDGDGCDSFMLPGRKRNNHGDEHTFPVSPGRQRKNYPDVDKNGDRDRESDMNDEYSMQNSMSDRPDQVTSDKTEFPPVSTVIQNIEESGKKRASGAFRAVPSGRKLRRSNSAANEKFEENIKRLDEHLSNAQKYCDELLKQTTDERKSVKGRKAAMVLFENFAHIRDALSQLAHGDQDSLMRAFGNDDGRVAAIKELLVGGGTLEEEPFSGVLSLMKDDPENLGQPANRGMAESVKRSYHVIAAASSG